MTEKSGRPLKSEGPAIPAKEVDTLLVNGEIIKGKEGKGTHVHYPSYRELGDRYGVSYSSIAKFAKAHNCLQRHKIAKKRLNEMTETKLLELRSEEIAMDLNDQLRIIDRYLIAFEEALKEGRVRCDNPTDYNLMIRLKNFLQGNAESRREVISGPSLEDLQKLHKAYLKQVQSFTPEMTGRTATCRVVEDDQKQIGHQSETNQDAVDVDFEDDTRQDDLAN